MVRSVWKGGGFVIGMQSAARQSRSGGTAQLLRGLDLDTGTQTAEKKPGYLSADGTEILRTDTATISETAAKAAKEKKKLAMVRLGTHWKSAAIRSYARLARARSQQECKTVAYSAGQQIGQLKRALSLGCDDKLEVQAMVGQMQKAVIRAKLKVRQLDEEQDMQRRSRKAEEQQRRAKALYLEQQRQKKAVARQVRETGYIRESVVDRYQAAVRFRQQAEAGSVSPAPAISDGAVTPAVPTVPAAAPAPVPAAPAPAALVI